ncbi:MAG TPA: hypothetical protein VGE65_07445 [Sphingobium sp.]
MTPVTLDDRKKELRALLDTIKAHPEHDWTQARERIRILNEMIAGHEDRHERA